MTALLQAGAAPGTRRREDGRTALHLAAEAGCLEVQGEEAWGNVPAMRAAQPFGQGDALRLQASLPAGSDVCAPWRE